MPVDSFQINDCFLLVVLMLRVGVEEAGLIFQIIKVCLDGRA